MALVPASADQTSALLAQRQQLQQQVGGLGGGKAKSLSNLLAAQDALNNLQGELRANSVYLSALGAQQADLRGRMSNTEHDLAQQHQLIAEITRGQYKTATGDQTIALIFASSNFKEMLGRLMSEITVQRRVSDTAHKIKLEQNQLKGMAADLSKKQAQAALLRDQLTQANGRELALVADYDQRVSALDSQSKALLGQISNLNSEIAIRQAPPPVAVSRASASSSSGFSSGGGKVNGGGSCGNHFSYGYCTYYVANRRCIPWFGNAWEWYGQAQAYGYPVGHEARVGAVVVWDQRMSGYGHVGYVESVQGNGFTVSEMNYNGWNQVDTRFVPYSNPGPLTGFVYAK
ncbi:MAG TPA: CHAP domain-containing protein [Candidatus Dormibacteraeota bacterium]|nr:CHAP domain-containing protein [Candidatus Dormibacteraeota bacterium]